MLMKMGNGEGQLCHSKKNEGVLMRAALSAEDVDKVVVLGRSVRALHIVMNNKMLIVLGVVWVMLFFFFFFLSLHD